MSNKPCGHRWRMLPGFVERYECVDCGDEGEYTGQDQASVPELPRERGSWVRSIAARVRRWRLDAARQGANTSDDVPDQGYNVTYAVSSTFLPDYSTYYNDD